jgi:hypothetical protein
MRVVFTPGKRSHSGRALQQQKHQTAGSFRISEEQNITYGKTE